MRLQEQRLVTRKYAAHHVGVALNQISRWATQGYITKYYTLGNKYNYLVDLDEIVEQDRLSYYRKRMSYHDGWTKQRRAPNGTFLPLSK